MSEFETVPIGTMERLRRCEERLGNVFGEQIDLTTERPGINFEAWARAMITFIREKGLEQEYTDWSGGWSCPIKPRTATKPEQEGV